MRFMQDMVPSSEWMICIFESEDLRQYFESKSWYHGYLTADEFDDSVLNQYERDNLELFKTMENMQ